MTYKTADTETNSVKWLVVIKSGMETERFQSYTDWLRNQILQGILDTFTSVEMFKFIRIFFVIANSLVFGFENLLYASLEISVLVGRF